MLSDTPKKFTPLLTSSLDFDFEGVLNDEDLLLLLPPNRKRGVVFLITRVSRNKKIVPRPILSLKASLLNQLINRGSKLLPTYSTRIFLFLSLLFL